VDIDREKEEYRIAQHTGENDRSQRGIGDHSSFLQSGDMDGDVCALVLVCVCVCVNEVNTVDWTSESGYECNNNGEFD
jgi:hypothetical protein